MFIFPYGGAGPAAFRAWMMDNAETQIVHYPGRGSRFHEPLVRQLAVLVSGLAYAIRPLLDKPFVFFGHSLGGLVAFELTRVLRRDKLPQPRILFLSACGAPQIPSPHAPLHDLPHAEFLNHLKTLNGIPSELLDRPEALELLLPIARADFEAVETHRHVEDEPLDVPIVAFGGLDDPRVSRERLEGWAWQTKSFRSHYFHGDHFFINHVRDEILEMISAQV